MRDNATFREGEPYFANACVGNNGEPDYYHYAKGYSSAANLLIKQTLEDNSPYPVDTFIYPICFNMRHSVELRLKGAVESLTNIFKFRKKFHRSTWKAHMILEKSGDTFAVMPCL